MSANSSSSDFHVNTYVSGRQEKPDIAISPLGNFVITWQSDDQDGDDNGIFARVYNSSVNPLSSEFRVNTTTTNDQTDPATAIDTNGNFVVTWVSDQQFSGTDIYAQRYSATGLPLGAEFQVNLSTEGDQQQPDVAIDANGNFVVVYESDQQNNNTVGRDIDGTGILGQRFDRSGALVGSEFRINTLTDNDQLNPVVAANAQGEFVVVWVSEGQDGSGSGIFGQRYSNAGLPVGAEFQVNMGTEGNQLNPSVALDNSGNFVVAWQSDEQDDDRDGYGVYARRYNSFGNPTTHDVLVNDTTRGDQITPAVAIDADGNFTVVWASDNQDEDGYGIFGQRFSREGRKTDEEFQVNSDGNNDQTLPTIGLSPISDFVVAWQNQSDSNDDQDILATSTTAKREIRGNRFDNTLKGTSSGDRILGLRGDDTLRGFDGNDVLEGALGNDHLEGGNNDDILLGGSNEDTLDGGNGNDNLTGGNGADTFVLQIKQGDTLITDFTGGVDFLGLSAGIEQDAVRVEQQGDNAVVTWEGLQLATLFGVSADTITDADFVEASRSGEEIRGTAEADDLEGTDGGDNITGLRGNDSLTGGAGDDTLSGGSGNDRLRGQEDNDSLSGGGGNDRLDGGDGDDYLTADNGNDSLTGGEGSDIFFLETKKGNTVIRDFQNGVDFLRLDPKLDANALQAQQQGLDTVISLDGQRLALLKNVIASQITATSSDFV